MGKGKLRTFINTAVFEIIDDWTHQHVATLPYSDAVEKYGDCEVWNSYTEGGQTRDGAHRSGLTFPA